MQGAGVISENGYFTGKLGDKIFCMKDGVVCFVEQKFPNNKEEGFGPGGELIQRDIHGYMG